MIMTFRYLEIILEYLRSDWHIYAYLSYAYLMALEHHTTLFSLWLSNAVENAEFFLEPTPGPGHFPVGLWQRTAGRMCSRPIGHWAFLKLMWSKV